MLVAALALMWLPSVPWQMVVVLLFVGAPIGPILVTIFKVAGDHTPARRLGFIMTLLSAGITLGTSIGNWVGGEVANAGGHSAAIWVPSARVCRCWSAACCSPSFDSSR